VTIDAHVLPHRQPRRQGNIGRGKIHPGQGGEAVLRHVVAEHGDAAGGGDQETKQHGDGGGFAGAVAAQQPNGGAGWCGEGNIVHRQHLTISFGEVFDLDCVHLHADKVVAAGCQGKIAKCDQRQPHGTLADGRRRS